jgi:hypothetical protein
MMSRQSTALRKVVAVVLMLTVGCFYSLAPASIKAQATAEVTGELSASGQVTLNGVMAISGATVFNDSRVKTGRNATAMINLGKLGRIELGANSEMVLRFAEGVIGGNLLSGRAVVSAPAGVGISVVTAEGVTEVDGKQASAVTVDVSCGNTRVASSRGDAKVTSGNRVEYVAAGQEVAVGPQQPGQGSRCTRLTAAGVAGAGGVGAGGVGAGGLSAGAIAAMVIAGVGGAVAGVVAASQSDNVTASQITVSGFRP